MKPKTEAGISKQAGKEAVLRGYVVVFEGDDECDYSAYSPDVPGVVAAAGTRAETERFMREAMAEHLRLLRATNGRGQFPTRERA